MAIPRPTFEPQYDDFEFNVQEFAIGGKLVSISKYIAYDRYIEFRTDTEWRNHVRKELLSELVEKIIENKFVEFTMIDDPTSGTKKVTAYMYLAPNDHIKILRSFK
jgi:hypothetical protein